MCNSCACVGGSSEVVFVHGPKSEHTYVKASAMPPTLIDVREITVVRERQSSTSTTPFRRMSIVTPNQEWLAMAINLHVVSGR